MPRFLVFAAVSLVSLAAAAYSVEVDIKCVPIRDCPELLNLLKGQPASAKVIKLLRTSACGYEGNHPKVWCSQLISNCRTPNDKPGKCVPAKKCEPFLEVVRGTRALSQEIKNYLQKFQCEDPNKSVQTFSVCCPLDKQPLIAQAIVTRPSFLPRPAEGECGRQLVSKIIGGKATEMNEFPWTALLEYSLDSETTTACGGSLISDRYVVTAAHCTDESALRRVGKLTNVILGEFDTRNKTDCINSLGIEDCADPPVKVLVEEIIVHPQWSTRLPTLINHDIALLRLATTVTFTDFIKPICLPSPTLTLKEGERLVITGWGQTEEAATSFVKLKATIPVANRDFCVQKYMNDKRIIVGDGELCVGGEEGTDSCSGDSGGPLMLPVDRSGTDIWFLTGVVSFGPNQPCGQKNYPALYTYLPKYMDWIYKTIKP